jgi:hypothetical protein
VEKGFAKKYTPIKPPESSSVTLDEVKDMEFRFSKVEGIMETIQKYYGKEC